MIDHILLGRAIQLARGKKHGCGPGGEKIKSGDKLSGKGGQKGPVPSQQLDEDRAHRDNALGPEVLALACRNVGALLITISTDYVFDGEKDGFYTQRDQPNPQGVYARSKLEGERRAQTAWARTSVVRSGYIFGPGGTNFLSTMLARARRGERLQVISDSFGTPTYARDLAKQLYRLGQLDLPGIYHVVNAGDGASFEDFARAAIEIAGLNDQVLENVSLETLNRPAPRPRNSRLRCLLSEALGLEPLPFWKDALADFVATQAREESTGRLAVTPSPVGRGPG